MSRDCCDHRIGYDLDGDIELIDFPGDGGCYQVGSNGVTSIEAYNEDGGMSYVPWFMVRKGARLYCKVNAAHVATVVYADEKERTNG